MMPVRDKSSNKNTFSIPYLNGTFVSGDLSLYFGKLLKQEPASPEHGIDILKVLLMTRMLCERHG